MAKKISKVFKEFFVSFYKGYTHIKYYRLVLDRQEVLDEIKAKYGKVTDLVVDQVI